MDELIRIQNLISEMDWPIDTQKKQFPTYVLHMETTRNVLSNVADRMQRNFDVVKSS